MAGYSSHMSLYLKSMLTALSKLSKNPHYDGWKSFLGINDEG
jgi:hypothetical protein